MSDRYLELLSDFDLCVLGSASGVVPSTHAPAYFRTSDYRVVDALMRPEVSSLVPRSWRDREFDERGLSTDELQVEPSAVLCLAVLVHKAAAALLRENMRVERIGGATFRRLGAVSAGTATAQDMGLRLALVEILDSFTGPRSTSSLSMIAPSQPPQPVDERNPLHLVQLLDRLPPQEHPGIYRRLGDLALFHSGLAQTRRADFDEQLVAGQPFTGSEMGLIARSLAGRLFSPNFVGTLADMASEWTIHELFGEFGPIWYRMAARSLPTPALARPLLALADSFDDAAAFLGYLQRSSGLTVSHELFASGPKASA